MISYDADGLFLGLVTLLTIADFIRTVRNGWWPWSENYIGDDD